MQKNMILLGGPEHGKMVPIFGPVYKCLELIGTKRSIGSILDNPPPMFRIATYLLEYRGRTIFGVYQKPKD